MEAGVVVVKTEQDVDMPLPVKKKGRIARMQDLTKDEADTAGADANATGAGESGDDARHGLESHALLSRWRLPSRAPLIAL